MHTLSLSPTVLSNWLRSSGLLYCGEVTALEVDLELKTATSALAFLTVSYSPDAPVGLPDSIVVKKPFEHPGDDWDGEAQFYHRLAPALGTPPVVRSLAVVEDDGEDTGTVVLEDLRSTHDHPQWPLPPSRAQSEMAIDALARIHSHWWESPLLGNSIGRLHTVEGLTKMLSGITDRLPAFMDAFGDSLTTDARDLYRRVFTSSLRPWTRIANPRALTVVHGDAHTWNFLFPRARGGSAYLIDWQLWHLDVGARDLAFLIALHWYRSRRLELEEALVRRYHNRLLSLGVDGYPFEELWLDYRRCAVRNLTLPLILWSRGMKPEAWWHRLECAVEAYRDLDCDELL